MRIETYQAMRVAIPQRQGRVSPVLDAAGSFVLADVQDGRETARREALLPDAGPIGRARELSRLGVDVVVCGAVSRPLAAALDSAGLRTHPYVCGPVDDVLAALIEGRLDTEAFLMPGCCGRRRGLGARRRRGGRSWANGPGRW